MLCYIEKSLGRPREILRTAVSSDDWFFERYRVIPAFSSRLADATLSVIKFHAAFILGVCLSYRSPESQVDVLSLPLQ